MNMNIPTYARTVSHEAVKAMSTGCAQAPTRGTEQQLDIDLRDAMEAKGHLAETDSDIHALMTLARKNGVNKGADSSTIVIAGYQSRANRLSKGSPIFATIKVDEKGTPTYVSMQRGYSDKQMIYSVDASGNRTVESKWPDGDGGYLTTFTGQYPKEERLVHGSCTSSDLQWRTKEENSERTIHIDDGLSIPVSIRSIKRESAFKQTFQTGEEAHQTSLDREDFNAAQNLLSKSEQSIEALLSHARKPGVNQSKDDHRIVIEGYRSIANPLSRGAKVDATIVLNDDGKPASVTLFRHADFRLGFVMQYTKDAAGNRTVYKDGLFAADYPSEGRVEYGGAPVE